MTNAFASGRMLDIRPDNWPDIAVALNSSAIYVGQAAGSSTGSLFYDAAQYVSMGWAASALALIALLLVASTRGLTGLRGNG